MDDDDEPMAAAPAGKESAKKSAPKKRVKVAEEAEEDEGMEDEFQPPAAVANASGVVTRRAAQPAQAQNKRLKMDDEQEVSNLFQNSIRFTAPTIDISVKKFVYKLITQVQTQSGSSKVSIHSVWQKYFGLTDE